MKTAIAALTILGLTASALAAGPTSLPAFPGAEGFGSSTPGGRGGKVYEVTTLDDSGRGSLRDAVSQGNRTIVFRVSGTIDLKSNLEIRKSNITLAGQTAPGDGICLKNYTLNIAAEDVVLRFIRVRLGDVSKQQSDSITIGHGCRNVILDHCSATWSVDESLSTAGHVGDCTIQWCLIGEALRQSVHTKGPHGYGSLARADGPVTWHHNLWIHNDSRNPRLGDNYGRGSSPFFDVRNNVIYDFGHTCSGLTQGKFNANYVANYIRPGPSSVAEFPISVGTPSELAFFIRDNVVEGKDELTNDNTKFFNPVEKDGKRLVRTVDQPFDAAPVHTSTAKEAYEQVLTQVGASLPKRDSADAQIIKEVRDRTGKMINSQSEAGGWPELKSGEVPPDADHDGMPDEWEKARELNPNDPSDASADNDKDGYTNLEEYLNGTDPKQFVDYRDPKNNVDALLLNSAK